MLERDDSRKILSELDCLVDPRTQRQWLSSLRLADFLLRGGRLPEDYGDDAKKMLQEIADSDSGSETHLFACVSLALLGAPEGETHLQEYMLHESESFRTVARHTLLLWRN